MVAMMCSSILERDEGSPPEFSADEIIVVTQIMYFVHYKEPPVGLLQLRDFLTTNIKETSSTEKRNSIRVHCRRKRS